MTTRIMHIYTDMFASSNITWGSLAAQVQSDLAPARSSTSGILVNTVA